MGRQKSNAPHNLVLVRPSSIALKTLKNAAGQDLSVMSLQPPSPSRSLTDSACSSTFSFGSRNATDGRTRPHRQSYVVYLTEGDVQDINPIRYVLYIYLFVFTRKQVAQLQLIKANFTHKLMSEQPLN